MEIRPSIFQKKGILQGWKKKELRKQRLSKKKKW